MNDPDSTLTFPVLPGGTVTFLFTDIEGSTNLLSRLREDYTSVLADQRQLLRTTFTKWNGHEVDTQGDAFFIAFPRATDAVSAAVEVQRLLAEFQWPDDVEVRIRIGIHTGEPWVKEEGYVGMDVHRAARIGHVGHGGQVLLSETTATLVMDELPVGVSLLDLGRHQLKDMHRPERIRQLMIEGLTSDFPPLKSRETHHPEALSKALQRSAPSILTPFIGRRKELLRLNELICDPDVRLVTIVGPGGMGKTRLALQAAENILDNGYVDVFPNGVYFVSLASLQSIDAIESTIAESIGFRFYAESDTRQQLLDYLRKKAMLLILDNFEHLLEGVEIVTDILQNTEDVSILITSRTELHLQAEQVFPLFGMDTPDVGKVEPIAIEEIHYQEQFSAVQLFQTTACRTLPDFKISAENLSDVIRICQLVEGIPLAILLAAGWIKLLSPAEIATEIGQSLDILESDMSDVPDRQRSMRVVFDHSWQMLNEREQGIFKGLSVFRGGFTRDAAQQVTGAGLRELMALVENSLIQRKSDDQFDVHELFRQYSEERLTQEPHDEEEMRDRHSEYYLTYMQIRSKDVRSARQIEAMVEIESVSENAIAAWNWALQRGEASRLGQASDSLGSYYKWSCRYQEGETSFRVAAEVLTNHVAKPSEPNTEIHHQVSKIMYWQAYFTSQIGDKETSLKLFQESLTTLEQSTLPEQLTQMDKATILQELARHVGDTGSRQEALDLLNLSRELFQATGDQWGEATTLQALGHINFALGSYEDAKRSLNLCLKIRNEIGDKMGIADTLLTLGLIASYQGQLEEAKQFINESLVINEAIGYQKGVADGQLHLGTALFFSGAFEESHDLIRNSWLIFEDLGSETSVLANEVMAFVEINLGHYEIAQALAQEGFTSRQKIKDPRGIGLSLLAQGCIAIVREDYSDAQQVLEQAVNTYRSIEQQDELGSALALLGIANYKAGQADQSQRHLLEALEIGIRIHAALSVFYGLSGLALLQASFGDVEKALEIYAIAACYGYVSNSRWFEDVIENEINSSAENLPSNVTEAARAKGQARDLWNTAKEIVDSS